MAKFIKKLFVFKVSFIFLYSVCAYAIVKFIPKFVYDNIDNQTWLKVNHIINTSRSDIKNDTLYLGDSVADQLFNGNKTSNILTSMAPVLPIGNYFLMKDAIENNEHIKCVIYLAVPSMMGMEMNNQWAHGTFVKGFYTLKNRNEIMQSEKIKSTLSRNKFLPLSLFLPYNFLSIDDYDYSVENKKPYDILPEESIEWLIKMKNLCELNNVKFHLASPPVVKYHKKGTNDWSKMKKQVEDTELKKLFENYFKTVIYIEEKHLKDKIHWKYNYIEKNKHWFLSKIKKRGGF